MKLLKNQLQLLKVKKSYSYLKKSHNVSHVSFHNIYINNMK